MPVGTSLAVKDELGPAYAFGRGAAAPSMTALAGGLATIRGLTFTPGDYIDVVIQMNHDVEIPPTGNVSLSVHAHWSAVAAPAAGATVIWEFDYFGAAPSLTGANSFPASLTTLTASTYTCDGNEVRKHYMTVLGTIDIPVASYGNSYILWGTFRLKSTSTVAAGKVNLLSFDLHKTVGQFGSTP